MEKTKMTEEQLQNIALEIERAQRRKKQKDFEM